MDDYLRMAEDGYLADGRHEFVDGEILRMPPQRNDHLYVVTAVFEALTRLLQGRHWVRSQATLKVDDTAMPEPDIAVIEGPKHGGTGFPTGALSVIEVSDTTLRYDRQTKASLYALAGVPEYWIINLIDRKIEIHRELVEEASAQFGWGYASRQSHPADAELPLPASLGAAGATLRGVDLLP